MVFFHGIVERHRGSAFFAGRAGTIKRVFPALRARMTLGLTRRINGLGSPVRASLA